MLLLIFFFSQFAVLSALEGLSSSHGVATHNLNMLSDAKSQLQKLQVCCRL